MWVGAFWPFRVPACSAKIQGIAASPGRALRVRAEDENGRPVEEKYIAKFSRKFGVGFYVRVPQMEPSLVQKL